MPTELIRLCQQKRGMYSPWRSAAAMTSSPLRAVIGRPLIVMATAFGSGSGSTVSAATASATVVVDGRRRGRFGGLRRRRALARLRVVGHACAPATAATGSGASMTVSGMRVRGLILASNSSRNSVSAEWTGT